jgi:tetratricopeptide (TPR) repeat protein
VNRQQIYVIIIAATAVALLFFWGRTKPRSKNAAHATAHSQPPIQDSLTFESMLSVSRKRISAERLVWVDNLQKEIVSTRDISMKIDGYRKLSRFWMDSIGAFVPYVKYLGEAAKLENSEKSLTFAAHLMLAELQSVTEQSLQIWLAKEARLLFEKAKNLNPSNDSTLVGLGSCYFFGAGGNEPPMKGIMLVREVAERSPENVFAQYMLGIGATVSRQLDKAAERFTKVVQLDPDNMEAWLRLADVTEQKGDKAAAKMHYQSFLKSVKRLEAAGKFKANPEMIRQIETHIDTLK